MTPPDQLPSPVVPFGQRLQAAVEANGPVCLGIDPHVSTLQAWGYEDTPAALEVFSRRLLAAADGLAAAIKPQSAFFERHGSHGIAVLEELLAEARARRILTILDVKRGDIGSTMSAYAEAYLRPGSPLEADAMTVSPYLGPGSLSPCLSYIANHGKGIFALALTSNPDGPTVQHATDAHGRSVAGTVIDFAARVNRDHGMPEGSWGSVGVVVGATVDDALSHLGLDLAAMGGAVLAPGFGAQGARLEDREAVFGNASSRVLISVSRAVAAVGPDPAALRAACAQWSGREQAS
ncbi:orotidine-5'-phosphate decarboxylase [Devriesea agamarum]|uniref:orotidine-5'-phosphate decarboxylase n=1 Tax=Devriesea agamarum TaxID=472569 RepID=UPI00071C85ED|nr:orotidine-5'-phosphate decarboxylase [Devriesea agamarum]